MENENSKNTQCKRLLEYLEKRGSITQLDAIFDLGIMRLAARIYELRRRGVDIEVKRESAINRYEEKVNFARYFLKKKKNT